MLQLVEYQLNFFFLCLQAALQSGMERVQSFFLKNKCRLPLNPSLVAKELNIKVQHIHSFKTFLSQLHIGKAFTNWKIEFLKALCTSWGGF